MKALILAAMTALAFTFAPLSAAVADNDIGCGVGTEIWKGNSGLGYKLLASWTNGITFQSLSITFGLLNCDGRGTITANARARHFAASSFDRIARDAALGGGESLETLATLLEVDPANREAFGRLAQRHFETLFSSDEVTSDEMLEALVRVMDAEARQALAAS